MNIPTAMNPLISEITLESATRTGEGRLMKQVRRMAQWSELVLGVAAVLGSTAVSATPPFVRETPNEFQAVADLDSNALMDVVVVDKATGNFRVGYGDAANVLVWGGVRPSGMQGVTGFTVGTVLDPARQALVFTAPEANRVQVVDVADRGRASQPVAVYPGGVGPNWVVALDIPGAGPATEADLVVGSLWNADPFRLAVVRSAAGSFLSLTDQLDVGPLSRGNALELRAGGPVLTAGLVSGDTDTGLVVHRFNGFVPQVEFSRGVLGAKANYAVGRFRGTPRLEFVFWEAGRSNLVHQPIEEPIPDQFQLGVESRFSLGEPIGDLVVIEHTVGWRLWIRSIDGMSAAVYDFDGVQAPVLVERWDAALGEPFTGALSIAPGEILALQGRGQDGVTHAARRLAWNGTEYVPGKPMSLPALATSTASANVLYFKGDPLVDETAVLLGSANARDWASRPVLGASVGAQAETYRGVNTGLGGGVAVNLGAAPAGTTTVLASQVSDAVSLFSYQPPAGEMPIDVSFSPTSPRHESAFDVTVTPSVSPQEIFFRLEPRGPWMPYTGPFRLVRSATVQAYAVAAGGTRSPVRSISYVFDVSPRDLDSDKDGVPDYVEAEGGLDPILSGPDADGDGYSDLEELVNGSDPRIATNAPAQGGERLGPLGSFEMWVTLAPPDPATGLPTQADGGTVVEVHRPEGGLLQSASLPKPAPIRPLTRGETARGSVLLAPIAYNSEHPLLILSTPPTFGVRTSNSVGSAGLELLGIEPLPALAVPELPKGTAATNAAGWIAAASNRVHQFKASNVQAVERTLGPLDTLVALLVERKIGELLRERGQDGATNLTLFPFRPTDAARTPVGTADLLALQQRVDDRLPGHRLATVYDSIAQATLEGTDAETALLREVALGVYLVSARSNAVSPGLYPAPVETLRDLLRSGVLNPNHAAANGWTPADLASVPGTVARLLASVPARPVSLVVGHVRADSFGGTCSILDGPSGPVVLVDERGNPFRVPDVFGVLPGTEVSVSGYTDVVSASCSGAVLEVISAGVVAIPEATVMDANGNLLPDPWELRFTAGGERGETFQDRDGDGYSAFQEMLEGTDPGQSGSVPSVPAIPLSPPRMTGVVSTTDPNLIEFSWSWPAPYADRVTFGLKAGGQVGVAFEDIATSLVMAGDTWTATVPRAELPQRFFRLAMRLR